MRKKHIPILIVCNILSIQMAQATENVSSVYSNYLSLQQNPIKGRVVDNDGFGISDAEVKIIGTDYITITDENGYFNFEVYIANAKVSVNTINQESFEFNIPENGYIDIKINKKESNQLSEVVVTALGIKRNEKQLGYAQQKLNSDDFTDAKSNNWTDNLKGKVAGMTFTSSSSGPMNSTQVVLRGNRSIDANNNGALIVVDGIPINSGMNSSSANSGYLSPDSPVDFGSGMNDINPDDIENVTILKGAGATALYGSRAANGAIMITTKSGKKNQGLGITFNSTTTLDVVQRWPEWQNEYGSGTGKVFNDNGELYYSYNASADGQGTQSNLGFGPKFNGQYYFQYDPATGQQGTERTLWKNYENSRKGIFKPGSTFTNSIQLTGGNEKSSFRASLTQLDNNWILPNTGYKRTTVSTKVDYEIAKGIKVSSSVNYSNRSSDNLPNTGYNNQTISYFNILTNADTNLDWYRKIWLDDSKTQLNSPFSTYLDNPYALFYEILNSNDTNTLTGSVSVNFDITKNLKLMVRTGINSINEKRELKRPYDLVKFAKGYYEQQLIQIQEVNTDFLLSYNSNQEKDFIYNISVGGNILRSKYYRLDASATGLSVPDVYKLSNAANGIITQSADSNKKVNSLYALASLSYRNLVFLDLTARNDWSSTLPAKNNSYFYPSANLSVILSDIFELPSFFSFAKYRLSLAQVGNDSRPYVISKYYDQSEFTASAQVDNQLYNADLKPETTNSFEVGLDLRFFKNRVNLDVAYYNTISKNQIITVPLDYVTGYTSKYINAGKVRNRGFEALLTVVPIQTKDFSWSSTFTYAKNNNEILELAAGIDGGGSQTLATGGSVSIIGKVGGSTGDMYGYGFVRNEDGRIIYDAKTGLPIRPREVTYQGNAYADWKGGWVNNFRYKNWAFNFTIDGSFGGLLYSQSYHKTMEHGHLKDSLYGREEGFIIGNGVVLNTDGSYSENTTKVEVPNYYSEYYRRANVEANSFKNTYVKIREVSIAYSFSKKVLEKTKLKGLTLSVFGRNLYTWSDFPFYDPETAQLNGAQMVPGVEMGQLPTPATYGFNLKVSL